MSIYAFQGRYQDSAKQGVLRQSLYLAVTPVIEELLVQQECIPIGPGLWLHEASDIICFMCLPRTKL